jgi:hypothetical protein
MVAACVAPPVPLDPRLKTTGHPERLSAVHQTDQGEVRKAVHGEGERKRVVTDKQDEVVHAEFHRRRSLLRRLPSTTSKIRQSSLPSSLSVSKWTISPLSAKG